MLGDSDPRTLAHMAHLAASYDGAGQLERAIELYQRAATDLSELVGPRDANVLALRANLVSLHRRTDRLGEAIDLGGLLRLNQCVAPHRCDLTTLSHAANLTIVYRAAGRYDDAIATGEATLQPLTAALGDDHRSVETLRQTIAGCHRRTRVDEADDVGV